MSICAECKYYEEIEREFQATLPEYPVNEKSLINKTIISRMHVGKKEIVGVCANSKNVKKNFISGESLEKDVELFNEFGQCELFVGIGEEDPIDIPEYPKLQIVVGKQEILTEEELEIKCYASIKKDELLSYKWFVNEEEIEDCDVYNYIFSSEEEGEFKIKCEVTNIDKACADRQTSTSYMELDIVVTAPEEENPEEPGTDDTPTEPEGTEDNTTETTTEDESETNTEDVSNSDYF